MGNIWCDVNFISAVRSNALERVRFCITRDFRHFMYNSIQTTVLLGLIKFENLAIGFSRKWGSVYMKWYLPICFGTVRPCIIWYSKPNVTFLYTSNGCYVCMVVSSIYELPLIHIRTFINDGQPVGNKSMKPSGLVCFIYIYIYRMTIMWSVRKHIPWIWICSSDNNIPFNLTARVLAVCSRRSVVFQFNSQRRMRKLLPELINTYVTTDLLHPFFLTLTGTIDIVPSVAVEFWQEVTTVGSLFPSACFVNLGELCLGCEILLNDDRGILYT